MCRVGVNFLLLILIWHKGLREGNHKDIVALVICRINGLIGKSEAHAAQHKQKPEEVDKKPHLPQGSPKNSKNVDLLQQETYVDPEKDYC